MKKTKKGMTGDELKKSMHKFIKKSAEELQQRLRAEWKKNEKKTKKISYV